MKSIFDSDKNLIYPGEENLYVESYLFTENLELSSGIEKTRLKKIPFEDNFITFGSFNNF